MARCVFRGGSAGERGERTQIPTRAGKARTSLYQILHVQCGSVVRKSVANAICVRHGQQSDSCGALARSSKEVQRQRAATSGSFEGPLFVQSVIPLSPHGGPLFRQVYAGLRKAILSGAFKSGER